jgi:beta-phosphoglucomutase-like phosphatase (HAD superfamily)
MSLRFACLILDHDDTAVDSTATVHYPAHVEAMRVLRPGRAPVSLEGWFLKNFHPGIMPYLQGELGLSTEEMAQEFEIWRSFTTRRTPRFFTGFLETLAEYRARGGRIAVISHSDPDVIRGHYRSAGPLVPDLVYGWDDEEEKRKPSPWPVRQVLASLGVPAERALLLDDLKPGVLMAAKAGVAVAGAGWAHSIGEIREYMQASCLAYFETVGAFRDFLLGDGNYCLPM